jgi:diguanylate cyclase (GGDEF)-like protein/PAS domain S-box-containing protein
LKDKPVILVVDDQLQNIELLEAHLVTQGYEIIPAESGEEALEKLSGNHVDLVLLDVKMPGMSGFEVLAKLRADKKTGRIPVVMITAYKESEDRVKALKSGCDDFIFKPFDKHELLARVKSLLRIKFLNDDQDDSREFAESVINTVREPLISLDQDLRVVTVSRSFYEFFKVKPEETVGQLIYDLGNKQWDILKLRELLETILPQKTTFDNYEVEHDFAGIGRRIMLLNARQIKRGMGKDRIILLAMEDITERKLVEERIREVIRQQQAILDNIPSIAWLKDRNGKYIAVNDPFGKAFGVAPVSLVGMNDHDLYPPDLAVKYERDSNEVMAAGKRTYFEESIVGRDGKIQHVEKIETPIFNDAGVVIGIIGIAHDITDRKEVEITLRHDSTHDMLTGLYNRAFFDEELERLVDGKMFPLSIVMADVNGLKTVNDTLGHEAGDNLIRMAARIILEAFRAEDIVARIGGDEFAVLLPRKEKHVAEEAVKRIMNCPEIVKCQVSIAFGIATAESKDQLAEALKQSDERMYLNKCDLKKS